MATINLKNLTKLYPGNVRAVNNLNLVIDDGIFFSILGPSGCGKTTTLRMIAGLEEITSGSILIDGEDISKIPPYHREMGMVFQDYALFPHMTVFENISFGLKLRKWSKSKCIDKVSEMLELVQLPGKENRFPAQLSGGEQQRIALARALASNPKVLLLDEPLSNLDLKLRQSLRLELRELHSKLKITTIFVTHDQGEALSLADEVAIMKNGEILQKGNSSTLYREPKSTWLSNFLGTTNIFQGIAMLKDNVRVLKTDNGICFELSNQACINDSENEIQMGIRPERILIFSQNGDNPINPVNTFRGKVVSYAYTGNITQYLIEFTDYLPERVLVESLAIDEPFIMGSDVLIKFESESFVFF